MKDRVLDNHLRNAMIHLRDSRNPYKGVVAAGVIYDGRSVYATSEKFPDGRSIHAERNAIRDYTNTFGLPGRGTVIVVTLSPCSCDSVFREGSPCIDLVTSSDQEFPDVPVSRVHVATQDSTQDISGHLQNGLNLTTTTRPKLITAAENLFSYFREGNYGKPIPEFVDRALEGI